VTVALLVLAVLVPACSNDRPRLQFLGDSITVLSASQLHQRFDGRFIVDVDAFVGVTTSGMLEQARVAATAHPKVVVINLGTNDVGCTQAELSCVGPYSPARTEADLRAIAGAFPSSTCVIFVDLDTHVLYSSRAADLNRWLHSTFPRVVDWARAYRSSWFSSNIDPHPDTAGRARLVQLIDGAVSAC
jgi:hypothetical protein